MPEASSQTLGIECNYSTVWSSSIPLLHAIKKGYYLCCFPNGEVGGHVIYYCLHAASLKRMFHQEDPHMTSQSPAETRFFGESSCAVRATRMLIGDASSRSLLLCAFQHSASGLFRLRENASYHVLCIRFSVQFRLCRKMQPDLGLGFCTLQREGFMHSLQMLGQ